MLPTPICFSFLFCFVYLQETGEAYISEMISHFWCFYFPFIARDSVSIDVFLVLFLFLAFTLSLIYVDFVQLVLVIW